MLPILSRRDVIKAIGITSALSGLPVGAALAASKPRPFAGIVDSLLPGAREMSARFETETTAIYGFSGDPGRLWREVLEPRLRAEPAAVAGYTSAATLFCLQYLARGYGLMISAQVKGRGSIDSAWREESELIDLNDPKYSNRLAAYTWLLAPTRE